MTSPLLIIAAGGTGGHMFPAQALAEAMLARGWRVTLSTDDRGARYAGGFPAAVSREIVGSATFARGGLLAKLLAPFRILDGVIAEVRALRRAAPHVVIGFGGYPSIPALAAARILNIPRLIHEQNGVLGRVNRLFARHVAMIACGTWPTAVPKGVVAEHIGNPVRASIHERAGADYAPPGDHPTQVLVIGGSQGARVLSDVVPAALAALPPHLCAGMTISHQARAEDAVRVTAAYAKAGLKADVQPFFNDIPARMASAQLVISRAGASSIADLTSIGRPAILVPYAAATADHQTANARALADAGAAVVIPESGFTVAAVTAEIAGILGRPERAARMAAAALALGRPDATTRLAALVERLNADRKGLVK